jgi:N-sulfoglucosamine sulfohydrolase
MIRKLSIVMCALMLALSAHSVALAAPPKNIVLFVCDDLGTDVGCYGNPAIKTPHIDQLAREGTRYTHAFCTTASCSASRSVILTGLYNHANAQYGHEHSYHHFRTYDNIKSLPVRMREAGYRTARIGKFHVGPEEVYKFDISLPGNARSPVQMADHCRELFAAKSDKPFFLYICTADPHRSGARVQSDPHKPDAFGNKPGGYPDVEEVTYDPKDVIVPRFLPDTPTCRAELAQYYQSVSRIDQGLGRLVQNLKDAGVYDNTVILFTSDHGIAFPGGKTTLYEGGMVVPMIVQDPAHRPASGSGTVSDAMISLVDLTPTLLDIAGVQGIDKLGLHGRSFLPTVGQESTPNFDEVNASHTFHEITMYYPMRVVRTRQYKLIWNIAHPLPFPFASDLWEAPTWQEKYQEGPDAKYGQRTVHDYIHRPQFELYDLKADPDEIHNLAQSPEHKAVLAELIGKLKAFQKRTADPWILKWDYE